MHIILFISPGRRLRCSKHVQNSDEVTPQAWGSKLTLSPPYWKVCVWESCIFLCSSSYCVPIIPSTRVLESIYSPWSSLVYLTVSHMLSGIIRGLEGCWAILPFKRPPTTEKERPLAAHSWTVPCSQHLVLHKLWVAAFNVLWELGLNWVTNIQEVKGSHHTLDMMY